MNECYSVLLEADDGTYICVSVDRRGKVVHEFYEEDGEAYSRVEQRPSRSKADEHTLRPSYAGIFE
jgi:hypothetical protein